VGGLAPGAGGVTRERGIGWAIVAGYLFAGAINLIPIVGASGGASLMRLYGVQVDDPDLLLLLRHRAMLLSAAGLAMLVAAARPSWRPGAGLLGLASMASFAAICLAQGSVGSSLQRVLVVDLVAVPVLMSAWVLSCRTDGDRRIASPPPAGPAG